MSVVALLAPVALIAAMLLLIAYARRQFRPRVRDDRDLAASLGMTRPASWTPRANPRSAHGADGGRNGRDGGAAAGGDGGDGGGEGGGGD